MIYFACMFVGFVFGFFACAVFSVSKMSDVEAEKQVRALKKKKRTINYLHEYGH
jgi:hypothetical protein